MYIDENNKIKIHKSFDVAVCGGGFAGISAAIAAARNGAKTVLFEKGYMLGGLGTAGLVTIYLPLCDGYGHQVSFGISEELLRLSVSYGAEALYPENWLDGKGTKTEKDKRFEVRYNAQVFAILAEKLLLDLGVEIMYGTYAVGVDMKGDKISHVITENKSGRLAWGVKSVVDATGDCDIAHFSGAPTEVFKQGNILAAWYYYVGENGYNLNLLGASDIPDEEKTGNESSPLIDRRFTGLDGDEISEFTALAHKTLFSDFLKRRETDKTVWPVTIATTPQLRMTRKIAGEYELSHTETFAHFDDSIGMVSNWKKRGPVYEVPFRTLYSKSVKNLVCAGRCTSVNEALWDVMRVIPCCAVTGEAAGTAAALTSDFPALDVSLLQNTLVKNGVRLHISEVL